MVVAEQRRRLALLALIAAGRGKGVSRDKLVGYLSPESTSESARHSLHQLLYYVRQQAGEDVLLGTDPLRLNPDAISSDAADFEDALDRGDFEAAVGLYRGPFLDGFHVADSVEFETWAAAERSRLAGRYGDALTRLAVASDARQDHASAVEWWTRLAVLDPLGGRAASGLIRARAAAGDVPAALRHAATHEALVRAELGTSIAAELAEFVATLRRGADDAPSVITSSPRSEPRSVESGSPAGGESGARVPEAVGRRFGSRRRIGTVFVTVALATVAFGALSLGWPRGDDVGKSRTVAVLPFQITSPDAAVDWLRDGLVELIAIQLADARDGGSVDPRRAIAAWTRAGGAVDGAATLPTVLVAADALGARWAITGTGVQAGGELLLNADVVDVLARRAIARVSVRGHPDSILRLVDSLAVQIVTIQSGDVAGRPAMLRTASVPAMRAYLRAGVAMRRGEWSAAVEEYDQALTHDPAFASAALGLRLASGLGNGLRVAAAESIAYHHQDRLSTHERSIFLAEFGPAYPSEWRSPAARLRTWRAMTSSDLDDADAWLQLGLAYLSSGNRIDAPNALEEAGIALERALQLGSNGDVVARMQLQSIAGVTADPELLERVLATLDSGEVSPTDAIWRRWLRAFARRDSVALAAVRPSLQDAAQADLASIWRMTQRVGFLVDDGVWATSVIVQRARTAEQLVGAASLEYHLALNRGRPAEAQVAARHIAAEWRPLSRLAIHALSSMYGDGDSVAGAAAARQLASEVTRPLAVDATEVRSQMIHVCVSAQWSLMHGEVGTVDAALTKLRTPEPVAEAGAGSFFGSCAATVAAWRAVLERRLNARQLVERLDSLQREGTAWHWALPEHRITARLWDALGEPALALRAVRRRRLEAMSYIAADLDAEATFALRAADTTGAVRAWRHYLALRSAPEASMRPRVDSVRSRVALLGALMPARRIAP